MGVEHLRRRAGRRDHRRQLNQRRIAAGEPGECHADRATEELVQRRAHGLRQRQPQVPPRLVARGNRCFGCRRRQHGREMRVILAVLEARDVLLRECKLIEDLDISTPVDQLSTGGPSRTSNMRALDPTPALGSSRGRPAC